jgi:hypothetical protein
LGSEAACAVELEFLVEFGTGGDGMVLVREAGMEFDLDGELQGVEKSVSHVAIDTGVEECSLHFHDGEHDGLGIFEDGEFDAGVLVHADGTAEPDAASFTTIPLVVEVAEGLVTKRGGAAFSVAAAVRLHRYRI